METQEKDLKFGWTYACLADYGHGMPKGFYPLGERVVPRRLATAEEQLLLEWIERIDPRRIEALEWGEIYTDRDLQNGTLHKDLQACISSDLPLSELTIRGPYEPE